MGKWQGLVALLLLLVVGGIFRLYALGTVPHGLAWDEAAIGYNGFAILETRRDEWLQRLPVSFRSFGDYKAPLAIYVNGISTAIFGLTPFGVRLPFAVAGIVSIGVFAAVIFELWRSDTMRTNAYLFGALLLVTSPWHIHYSRVAFESGLSLLFLLIAVFCFLRFVVDQRIAKQLFWICASSISASLSMYSYHSAKLAVPVLFLGLVIVHATSIKKRGWGLFLGALLASAALFPLLKDAVYGNGLTRANVSVFTSSDSLADAVWSSIVHFVTHLQHQFLVLGQTTSLRHGDGMWGVLLPTTYLLVLLALGVLAVKLSTANSRSQTGLQFEQTRRTAIALLWIFAGLLPAAIGTEIPHSNRALLALPGFLILAVEGMSAVWRIASKLSLNQQVSGSHGEKDLLPKMLLGTIVLLHVLTSVAYVQSYFTTFAANSAAAFSDGYLEAFALATQYEKGTAGKPEVEKIMFSDAYGQPYIYALFVRKTDPIWYQGGSLIKYQFAPITQGDLARQNALVVATADEGLPVALADHIVYGSDGSIRFLLYHTPK